MSTPHDSAPADKPKPDDEAEFRRLRWRCRRGMRELDQLLERWLDREWRQSPTAERAVFLRLLDSEDDRLWKWFLGHQRPDDDALAALVDRIRALPH
ncbi:succinate dehydrogenase assembly factor 2 [Luteimonas sp. MJ174]|uniref:FAD assembly factor SdhE n=1 Tax=Luteimonas sp. MJ174 TaxID=3129237 RepID=UPI0031BB0264